VYHILFKVSQLISNESNTSPLCGGGEDAASFCFDASLVDHTTRLFLQKGVASIPSFDMSVVLEEAPGHSPKGWSKFGFF